MASTEAEGFKCLPASLDLDPNTAYLHFTTNETIHGVEFFEEPTPPAGVPLVCDASSDFISSPVDVSKYALIYAGAQKNAGPAGVTIVIARDEMLERTPENVPVMLDYKALAASGSLHNTPPAFAIYMVGLVFQGAKKLGGLPEVQKINRRKADLIYTTIDESGGFYRGHAVPEARSVMNIPFRLPSEGLEDTFAKEAKSNGLIGLKGHRSVCGSFRGYRREVLEATDFDAIRITGYVVHGEMAYQAWINGCSLGEVPIHFKNRARAASKLSGEEIYMALLNFALLRFRYGWRPRRRGPGERHV